MYKCELYFLKEIAFLTAFLLNSLKPESISLNLLIVKILKKILKKKTNRKNIFSNTSISGIFFLKKNFLTKIKKVKIDLTDLIIKQLNKERFYSYFSNEKFSDFGTFKRYKKLKKSFRY